MKRIEPPALDGDPHRMRKKQRVKMVQGTNGAMSLAPVSWLESFAGREALGVNLEDSVTFNSLINFSETFEDVDR